MPTIELSAGPVDYQDTGGDGPVLVLVHGLVMDGTVWRKVVAGLRADYRCVVPTLPLGSHQKPMKPGADLSAWGQAKLLAEFVERLELHDVTLVQNDIGLGQLVAGDRPDWLGRLVLIATEAFENYPPGLPGKLIGFLGRYSWLLKLAVDPLRFRIFQPLLFSNAMAKHPLPPEIVAGWFRPLQKQKEIRRDLVTFCRTIERDAMMVAADRLKGFDRPSLVIWALDDRMMPRTHGRRLADLLNAPLIEIADSRTLIQEDQPAALTAALREFVPVPA